MSLIPEDLTPFAHAQAKSSNPAHKAIPKQLIQKLLKAYRHKPLAGPRTLANKTPPELFHCINTVALNTLTKSYSKRL